MTPVRPMLAALVAFSLVLGCGVRSISATGPSDCPAATAPGERPSAREMNAVGASPAQARLYAALVDPLVGRDLNVRPDPESAGIPPRAHCRQGVVGADALVGIDDARQLTDEQ